MDDECAEVLKYNKPITGQKELSTSYGAENVGAKGLYLGIWRGALLFSEEKRQKEGEPRKHRELIIYGVSVMGGSICTYIIFLYSTKHCEICEYSYFKDCGPDHGYAASNYYCLSGTD